MLAHPFEKFERRKFIRRLKELTLLKFDPALWHSLTDTDKAHLQHLAETALLKYYQTLEATLTKENTDTFPSDAVHE
jgi:hypothetical protein